MADETSCKDAQNPVCREPDKGPDWSICLPFGGRLYQQNGVIYHDPGNPPPDGLYDRIELVNGCVVGLYKGDVPVYTASPCAPVPCPCGEPSSSTQDVSTQTYIVAGDGIAVTGAGTASSPFVIRSLVEEQPKVTVTGVGAIEVTGDNSYRVAHKDGLSSIINGMHFDEYGHLVSYDTPTFADGVKEVKGGNGIDVEYQPMTGIATVSLSELGPSGVSGTYDVGPYRMEFEKGSLDTITALPEDSYILPTRHAYVCTSAETAPRMLGIISHAYGSFFIEVRNAGGLPSDIGVSVDGAAQVVVRQSIPKGDKSSDTAVLVACFCHTTARYVAGNHVIAVTAGSNIPAGTVITVDVCEGML